MGIKRREPKPTSTIVKTVDEDVMAAIGDGLSARIVGNEVDGYQYTILEEGVGSTDHWIHAGKNLDSAKLSASDGLAIMRKKRATKVDIVVTE